MSFDKKQVLTEIQSLLEQTKIPGTQTTLVKAGCVQRIIAHQGDVSIVLTFPPEVISHRESLKRTIEDGVAAIAGVKKVQILEKLPPGGGAKHPMRPPRGAARSSQARRCRASVASSPSPVARAESASRRSP